jgi:3-oxoacyl-(acyl-carrier-protein) synthase
MNIISKQFSRRVVISGMGMVTPLGNNVQESWTNLQNYKSGIRDLSNEKYAKDLPANCKIGATILPSFDTNKYRTLVIV